jgi:hypothetical protein
MVNEAEQAMMGKHDPTMKAKHAPSDVYRTGLTGGDDNG